MHKYLTTLLYFTKRCAKHFPVLLCTTKLAHGNSKCHLVLGLHDTLPSTTLYKTCTKRFPMLLCTTKFAQSTTLYYKACIRLLPVLHCITKLARKTSQLHCGAKPSQSNSKYYFALQSFHKAVPNTTLYYNTCRRYFPALLCTTKPTQKILQLLHKVPLALLRWATRLAQNTS